ncbi:MAG: hypothetical protein COB78_13335 [Hyphomicrobiales bacterium]|nr:MAG: hypothetical protein COB78_13335 [Hyphomicrobiales bacterium]
MDSQKKLTEAEVSIFIRSFERRTGVFTERVKDVSIWQLIRFEISNRLQGLKLEREHVGRLRLIMSLLRGPLQFLRLPHATYFCKTFDTAYRRQTQEGFEDIYFDDLKSVMPGMVKISSCDAVGYHEKVGKAVMRPIFDDTSVLALSAILGRIFPLVRRDPVFTKISDVIVNELKFKDYTPARIRRVYNVFRWRVMLYKLLLWRVRPQAVLCPDNGQFGLMRAAQLTGVPYIEMQHGVFTHAHPNVLPQDLSDDEVVGLLMPDSLAAYGQFSAEALRESRLYMTNRVDPVGAPFLERARAVRKNEYLPTSKIRITLSTQGIARNELSDFIKKFLEIYKGELELVIKLHPAYDHDISFYEKNLGADSRVVIDAGDSTNSTHTFIARSDLHLSISSTCHYDALGIGTPTGILALETHESVIELLDIQGVCLIETPEGLARIVNERAFGVVTDKVSRYFFENNFPNKVEAVLTRLCGPVPLDSEDFAK